MTSVLIPHGDIKLAGRLHRPAKPAKAAALIAHGLFSSMQSEKLTALARAMALEGITALQFDNTGCGDSPGDISLTTVTGRRDELLSAAKFLARSEPGAPMAYLGSSLGGTAAYLAADIMAPACVVLWSAPTNLEELVARMSARPEAAGLTALARDLGRHDLDAVLARTRRVLFIHGANDQTVPVEQARRGHRLALDPKDLVILPRADHRFSEMEDQKRAARLSLDWIERFSAASPA